MTIYLNPPPVPDAKWRENVKRDADKLGAELRSSRRRFLVGLGGGALVAAVTEYVGLRRTHAMFAHGGGTTVNVTVTAITNAGPGPAMGTTYQYLPDAIYQAATADTILIPAGTYAPDNPSIPYSNWQNLDSRARGIALGLPFPGTPSGTGNMFIGVGDFGRYSDADYLTIQGSGSASNGRAVLSRPYSTLASDFHSGDTTMHLVDASQWPPAASATYSFIWGDNSDDSTTYAGAAFTYTGISGNDLTGVSAGYGTTIPAGTMIMQGVVNAQSIMTSFAAPGHGNTFANLELWGSATYPAYHATAVAIRNGFSNPGGSSVGSFTLNSCYVHDCNHGVGLGDPCLGNDVFVHIFNTELYRNGYKSAASDVHNAYFSFLSEVIFDGSYSHFVQGAHLFKSRALVNYVTYSRLTGERTDSNSSLKESCNIDLPNGCLAYVIGNAFEQSLNASNNLLNYNGETDNTGEAANPLQELYFINNTCIGPTSGSGLYPHIGAGPLAFHSSSLGALHPEQSKLSSSTAGALAARTYVVQTTLTSSGLESAASLVVVPNGSNQVFNWLTVPVNKVLGVLSPRAHTGATQYNVYVNYMDPLLYQYPSFTEAGNNYYWDAAHTLPVFSQAAGGSLAQMYVYWGFTYQFATGESALLAVLGMDGAYGLSGANTYDGDYSFRTFTVWGAGQYEINASNVATVASPPSMTGATGWNVYACVTPWDGGSNFTRFGNGIGTAVNGITKQNASPIAIGTPWVEPTTGFIVSEQTRPNMFRQNASPITIGTDWTEPTSGIADHTPTGRLTWYRRGVVNSNGSLIDEWYAIAPSNLTNYTARVYYQNQGVNAIVSVIPISGATTPYPFSASLNAPVVALAGELPKTLTFSEGHGVVVAIFGSNTGTQAAGSGFTQVFSQYTNPTSAMAEYQVFSSAQTGLAITQTSGTGGDTLIADAVVGSGALTVGTPAVSSLGTHVNYIEVTFSCSSGDVLILHSTGSFGGNIYGIDTVPPPVFTDITAGCPTCLVKNNLIGNYYPAISGGIAIVGDNEGFPTGHVTESNNYQFNTWSGSGTTFDAPLWATVINDSTQANYDYRLKAGTAAIAYGADPGTSPIDLRPHYELKLFGSPTPGTPVPAKTARPNTAGVYDAGAFEYGV